MPTRTKPHNTLVLGDWNAICDRCGFKFKASQLREEPRTHLRVCKGCYDPIHPQDYKKLPEEDTSVPWARPEQADTGGTTVTGDSTVFISTSPEVTGNQTLTVGTSNSRQVWKDTLTSNVTVTLDTAGAQRGDRFQIYRTGGGDYTFDIGGLKTSLAGITFHAEVEFNGTYWELVHYTPLGL